MVTLIGI